VYAIYTQDRKRFRVSTGIKIPERYWVSNQLSKSVSGYAAKVAVLESVMSELMETVAKVRGQGKYPSVISVRNEFRKKPVVVGEPIAYSKLCALYLKFKTNKLAARSMMNIRQMFRVLDGFCLETNYKFDPSTFNRGEFERFELYLSQKMKLNDNTVAKHVRMLKAFLRWGYPEMKKDFINHKEFDGEVIYLLESELNILIKANLVGHFEKVRDLFVFLCVTGMRYSDSQRVDPAWIQEGVFKFRQMKTGSIAMPALFQTAEDILAKYDGKAPHMTDQVLNRTLKELFKYLKLDRPIETSVVLEGRRQYKISPLSSLVTSHVGRKTFITTCLNKGIPLQDVMRMSGHSDYRAMKPYISISGDHIKNVSKKWEI
jgi:integrase